MTLFDSITVNVVLVLLLGLPTASISHMFDILPKTLEHIKCSLYILET